MALHGLQHARPGLSPPFHKKQLQGLVRETGADSPGLQNLTRTTCKSQSLDGAPTPAARSDASVRTDLVRMGSLWILKAIVLS